MPKTATEETSLFDENSIDDEAFDTFDDKALDAAVQSIADSITVKFVVTEARFIAKLSTGERVAIPLTVTLKQFEEIEGMGDSLTQLKGLLREFSTDAEIEKMDAAPYSEALAVAAKYFEVFAKVATASLGK
jgi:hypothetical protein